MGQYLNPPDSSKESMTLPVLMESRTPTLLVFGTFPRMSALDPPAPSIAQRALAIKKAMAEITKLQAVRQVNDTL
jgi:hypothetical protein